ncbi:PLP-dependent transferase [Actibacterium sp. 188UL27-1]|nr:PLP-dependent transferase [Actibacterium sp. 188UL27-1]
MWPFTAFQTPRSLRTLVLRVTAHSAFALHIAEALSASERLKSVLYPGPSGFAQPELMTRSLACALMAVSWQDGGSSMRWN